MLLVVMVQQARVRAHEPPVAQQPIDAEKAKQQAAEFEQLQRQRVAEHEQKTSLAEQNQQKIEEYKWQTELMMTSYEQTVEQLAEQRLALSHLESHTRELSAQASLMQTEADMIANATTEDVQDQHERRSDLEQLQAKIASAHRKIEIAREELSRRTTKHVLIPYDGPNATQRPPIYVECFADRVVLQPENVELVGEDFGEPLFVLSGVVNRAASCVVAHIGIAPRGQQRFHGPERSVGCRSSIRWRASRPCTRSSIPAQSERSPGAGTRIAQGAERRGRRGCRDPLHS